MLSHRSAAEYYELPLLVDAREAELIVPRGGRVDAGAVPTAGVRRRNLTDAEMTAGVTAPLRTVLDCAADLPGAEALAALDSALRGDEQHPPLVAAAQLSDAADAVALAICHLWRASAIARINEAQVRRDLAMGRALARARAAQRRLA